MHDDNREGIIHLEHTPGCPAILAWDVYDACKCVGDQMYCLDCGETCDLIGDDPCDEKSGWVCPVCWSFMPVGGAYGQTVFWAGGAKNGVDR